MTMRERWRKYEVWVACIILACGVFSLGYVVASVRGAHIFANEQALRLGQRTQCAADKAQLAKAYADAMASQTATIKRMEDRLSYVQATTRHTATTTAKTAKKVGAEASPKNSELKRWTK